MSDHPTLEDFAPWPADGVPATAAVMTLNLAVLTVASTAAFKHAHAARDYRRAGNAATVTGLADGLLGVLDWLAREHPQIADDAAEVAREATESGMDVYMRAAELLESAGIDPEAVEATVRRGGDRA